MQNIIANIATFAASIPFFTDLSEEYENDPKLACLHLFSDSEEVTEYAKLQIKNHVLEVSYFSNSYDVTCFALTIHRTDNQIFEVAPAHPSNCIACYVFNSLEDALALLARIVVEPSIYA